MLHNPFAEGGCSPPLVEPPSPVPPAPSLRRPEPVKSSPSAAQAPTGTVPGYCPHCEKPITVPLPIEPVYPIPVVAQALFVSRDALVNLMRRHRNKLSPPLYRTIDRRRHRFLPASDVRVLFAIYFTTTRYKGKGSV